MDPLTIALTATQAAGLVASGLDVDPRQSLNIIRSLVVGLIGLAFLVICLGGLFGPARKGNTRRSWDITSASLIMLVPGVLGAAGIALAFGTAVLGWVIPGING